MEPYDTSPGRLTACKSVCKNMAMALEMYASDNKGRYPVSLASLIPGPYLKTIPTCPAAGRDTYSKSYVCTQTPDCFSFYCQGLNHQKAYQSQRHSGDSTNYPQFNAERGLLDHL